MNSTTMEPTPVPLRGKLNHVRGLLEDANKRLQDEANKYEIFATKTSAATTGSSGAITNGKQNGHQQHHEVPADLRRTMTDISTIQSVLSCPIFGQIVNVTDSLDKLSYHLNLRPSIGPVDINIDSNGELILAPPMEPASLNNLINSRLDEFSNQSPRNSPQISSSQVQDYSINQQTDSMHGNINGNGIGATAENCMMGHQIATQQMRAIRQQANNMRQQIGSGDFTRQQLQQRHQDENNPRNAPSYNAPPPPPTTTTTTTSASVATSTTTAQTSMGLDDHFDQQPNSFTSSSSGISPNQRQGQDQLFNNEKLVANKNDGNHVNGARRRRCPTSRVQSVAAAFENQIAESSENRRLYKANGNFALNQMDVKQTRSFDAVNRAALENSNNELSHDEPLHTLGYTNDMYNTTHELTGVSPNGNSGVDVMDYKRASPISASGQNAYVNNMLAKPLADPSNMKQTSVITQNQQQQQRVSPSTSASSTVPLADECDSGTSSFRSQAAKGTLYSPQSHKPIPQLDEDSHPVDSSLDQELIEKLSPDMERIKVTLEKDSKGLGITIAGYICEREEISGIFIKCITPGSPADKSGKIRILDQIFAVNGQEILGYSNAEATNVLRSHTSKVVTLELMRYLAESKYRKLQKLLSRAEPTSNVHSNSANTSDELKQTPAGDQKVDSAQLTGVAMDLIKAQPGMGAASSRRTSQSTVDGASETPPPAIQEQMQSKSSQPIESMYNNSSAFYPHQLSQQQQQQQQQQPLQQKASGYGEVIARQVLESQTPVAAQRGSSSANKVIETKQGARNTIDIRSPMCQTTTATYVNEVSSIMAPNNACSAAPAAIRTTSPTDGAHRSVVDRQKQDAADEFGQLVKTEKLEWERDVQIVELYRDSAQSLGFTVKDYVNPKDPQQSIFMIVLITPGGIAERDGRLSVGDLLVFVDDTNLEGASPNEAVRALKRTSGQVRLGVLKYKRDY